MPVTPSPEHSKLPIIPLRFKTTSQLFKSFMPWFSNGGLFIPTAKRFKMGQEVLMMVILPEQKDKHPVAGVVSWVSPENAMGHKKQGIGVAFTDQEGVALRFRIEELLGDKVNSDAPTYTL
jgi:type IV pilus assembly protein PilZ